MDLMTYGQDGPKRKSRPELTVTVEAVLMYSGGSGISCLFEGLPKATAKDDRWPTEATTVHYISSPHCTLQGKPG